MSFQGDPVNPALSGYNTIHDIIGDAGYVSGDKFYTADGSDVTDGGLTTAKGSALVIGDSFEVTSSTTVVYLIDATTTTVAPTTTTAAPVLPPHISKQPLSQNVEIGGSKTFTVIATSTVPMTYQWYKNSNQILGATSNTLVISNASLIDHASYFVKISNVSGSIISETASLNVGSSIINTEEEVDTLLRENNESEFKSLVNHIINIRQKLS
jgi:hypothetical protein